MIGVYIHIPFCLRKCPYCDFYSLPFSDDLAGEYTAAVLRAIKQQPFGTLRADTLYFGGGTPILLGPGRLQQILSAAHTAFGLAPSAEITLEANPATAMLGELRRLREAGFNRISFGVQSLQNAELTKLGRLHSAEQAVQAIRDAASAGFDNISADLMLAIPGQTTESLIQTIETLCALPVNHISAYLLKLEDGTPFSHMADSLALPDEDETAERYLACVEQLEHCGFSQYEISNFARDGRVSRHNMKYWRCQPYLGIGPAAHSFLNGRRFFFSRDLQAFVQADNPFSATTADGTGGDWQEQLMLGLRLTEGLALSQLKAEPGQTERILCKARELERHGLTRVREDSISLTPQGFLLSNSVIAALLGGL